MCMKLVQLLWRQMPRPNPVKCPHCGYSHFPSLVCPNCGRRALIVVTLFIMVALSSCSSPRQEAEAFAIQSQAEQDARDREQAREQQDALFSKDMEIYIAVMQQIQNAANRFVFVVGYLIILDVVIILPGMAIILLKTTNKMANSKAAAYGEAVKLRAHLIYQDPETMSYPLLHHSSNGVTTVHHPGVGSTSNLEKETGPNELMVATLGVTQASGLIANAAAKAKDPHGVAAVNVPAVVDVEWLKSAIPAARRGEE